MTKAVIFNGTTGRAINARKASYLLAILKSERKRKTRNYGRFVNEEARERWER